MYLSDDQIQMLADVLHEVPLSKITTRDVLLDVEDRQRLTCAFLEKMVKPEQIPYYMNHHNYRVPVPAAA